MEYLHQAFAFSRGMQGRRICHCEGRLRPWQSRAGTADPYWLPLKWHVPIASVAALTAQPLAALPLYGCAVSAATGAIGAYRFSDGPYELAMTTPAALCSPLSILHSQLYFRRSGYGKARYPRRPAHVPARHRPTARCAVRPAERPHCRRAAAAVSAHL